jgi:drug/metabolite transporter (DMT)-like permease
VITYVNPAVAVALGILALGERLTVTMAVAFVLILGGSVLATRTARPAPEPARDAGSTPPAIAEATTRTGS